MNRKGVPFKDLLQRNDSRITYKLQFRNRLQRIGSHLFIDLKYFIHNIFDKRQHFTIKVN